MSTPISYLTRALISPQTIASRGIRDTYTWHQLVWQAFPGRDGEVRDFLTRLDDKQGGAQVLIVSPREPVRPSWVGADDVWETKAIPQTYFIARHYRFQLRANVTKKLVKLDENGKMRSTGKRVALTKREDILKWLHRKGEQGGFVIPDDDAIELSTDIQKFSKKPRQGDSKLGTHGVVDFTGVLEVADPPQFHATFSKGMGSAKAFGFGLLVLAPIPS